MSDECDLKINCGALVPMWNRPRCDRPDVWCFYSFSLSSPQSKYNLAPIWFNHRGVIPAGKMDSFVQTERKRRIGGPEEMRRKSPEDRGMWEAAWWMETDEKRRKKEIKTRCTQWMRSLIGLGLVAPLQSFWLVPDRNQIILKFFNKEKENMSISREQTARGWKGETSGTKGLYGRQTLLQEHFWGSLHSAGIFHVLAVKAKRKSVDFNS